MLLNLYRRATQYALVRLQARQVLGFTAGRATVGIAVRVAGAVLLLGLLVAMGVVLQARQNVSKRLVSTPTRQTATQIAVAQNTKGAATPTGIFLTPTSAPEQPAPDVLEQDFVSSLVPITTIKTSLVNNHAPRERAIAWNPAANQYPAENALASVSPDGIVTIWNPSSAKPIRTIWTGYGASSSGKGDE